MLRWLECGICVCNRRCSGVYFGNFWGVFSILMRSCDLNFSMVCGLKFDHFLSCFQSMNNFCFIFIDFQSDSKWVKFKNLDFHEFSYFKCDIAPSILKVGKNQRKAISSVFDILLIFTFENMFRLNLPEWTFTSSILKVANMFIQQWYQLLSKSHTLELSAKERILIEQGSTTKKTSDKHVAHLEYWRGNFFSRNSN